MENRSPLSPAFDFLVEVEGLYAGLVTAAPEPGGRLLYAGILGEDGRALAAGANIAGAASLAVIPGSAAQKQAMREGIVDFVVNDLSEALRILKNQIRKREPVSVCIASAAEPIEEEMLARGVLPDLLGPAVAESLLSRWPASPCIVPASLAPDELLAAWSVAASPAVWLPRMDALAVECLPPDADAARRWLRCAPRFLGRLAQGVRVLRCPSAVALVLRDRVSAAEDLRDHVEFLLTND